MFRNYPVIPTTTITGDETQVPHSDPINKSVASVGKHIGSPTPEKQSGKTKSATVVIMLIFCNHKGVIS